MTNVALILSVIFWGVWGYANKQAVARAHPFTVQWMYAIPAALSIPLFYWLGGKATPGATLDRTTLAWAAGASVCSIAAGVCFLVALKAGQASWVVSAASTYPIVTVALLVATGQERLSAAHAVGVLLVVAGLAVFNAGGR